MRNIVSVCCLSVWLSLTPYIRVLSVCLSLCLSVCRPPCSVFICLSVSMSVCPFAPCCLYASFHSLCLSSVGENEKGVLNMGVYGTFSRNEDPVPAPLTERKTLRHQATRTEFVAQFWNILVWAALPFLRMTPQCVIGKWMNNAHSSKWDVPVQCMFLM